MIKTSDAYKKAITADARRVRVRVPLRIISPDIQYGGAEAEDEAAFSQSGQLYDGETTVSDRYAALELNRWILDGTVDFLEEDGSYGGQVGFISDALSGEDGTFDPPLVVSLQISGVRVLQACSVYFPGGDMDGTAADFSVEILQGGTVYHRENFVGNTAASQFVHGFTIYAPDAIRVTVTKWSLPCRRARIAEIYPGYAVDWTGKDLTDLTLTHRASVNAMSAPYGTASLTIDNTDRLFDPRNKEGLFQSLEERQAIPIEIGVDLEDGTTEYIPCGTYFRQKNAWATSDEGMTIKWEPVDIVGLLAGRVFLAPETLPDTLEGWGLELVGQLGMAFEGFCRVDPDYKDLPVTAEREKVNGKNCEDLLRWLCQATSTFFRADQRDGFLAIEPLWSQGNGYKLENLQSMPVISANDGLSSILFRLGEDENGEAAELLVSGNTASSANNITVDNPFISGQEGALKAARSILTAYGGNKIALTGRGDPSSEIGDVATVEMDRAEAVTARMISRTLNFSDGVLTSCKAELLQADGAFLYSERAVITESGSWTAPEGVSELEIILVGGGQSGGHGEEGKAPGLASTRAGDNWGATGDAGADGSGGRVWYGRISINPGQLFTVHIGAGGKAGNDGPEDGEDTVFGTYSSASGQVYFPAFTDISSGSAYGRSGVALPAAGTGDGGAGGKGGAGAYVYYEYVTDEFGNANPHALHAKYSRPAGEGSPGADGGSGCVVVYWNKG